MFAQIYAHMYVCIQVFMHGFMHAFMGVYPARCSLLHFFVRLHTELLNQRMENETKQNKKHAICPPAKIS